MKDHEDSPDNLGRISAELAAREPIFHRAEFGTTRKDFEGMIAPEFREIGASGKAYDREYVLDVLERRHREPIAEQLRVSEFRCQYVAPDHYLATYLLDQSGRISRRATLWRSTRNGWKIVYHQGTLVTD